jgi:ABC-type bacteriocin/lantibiotic exporter with double-glycine peptidase domain
LIDDSCSIQLFQTIINVAVLWYGGHLVLTGQLQKDLLVSFLLYQMQLADNIRQLGEVSSQNLSHKANTFDPQVSMVHGNLFFIKCLL